MIATTRGRVQHLHFVQRAVQNPRDIGEILVSLMDPRRVFKNSVSLGILDRNGDDLARCRQAYAGFGICAPHGRPSISKRRKRGGPWGGRVRQK